nr:META domain-containing protein [Acetobacter persici]
MTPSFLRRSLLVAAVCGVSAAVFSPLSAQAATMTLRGSVTYRERMALPPAVVEIRLRDASQTGENAPVLARTSLRTTRQVPVPFTLKFDRSLLKPGQSYALDATIFVEGRPWFTSGTPTPVPAGKKAGLLLVLNRASAQTARSPAGTWKAERLGDAPVAAGSNPPVLTLTEGGTLSGFSGCNRVRSKATVDGARITFGPMLTTRMACLPQAMMTEQLFLKNMEATRGWHLAPTGDVLALVDAQDKPTIVFRRQPADADHEAPGTAPGVQP